MTEPKVYKMKEIFDWSGDVPRSLFKDVVLKSDYDNDINELKAIIQRQAELISYFINQYPQTKDLAKIKSEFENYEHSQKP